MKTNIEIKLSELWILKELLADECEKFEGSFKTNYRKDTKKLYEKINDILKKYEEE